MPALLIKLAEDDDTVLVAAEPWLSQTTADARYLKLAADNDPLTGTLSTRTILPSTGSTYNLGSSTLRFNGVYAEEMRFRSQIGGVPTLTVDAAGQFNVTTYEGIGSATVVASDLTAVSGRTFAFGGVIGGGQYYAGSATLRSAAPGCMAFASPSAYLGGTSTAEATNNGAVVFGLTQSSNGTTARLNSSGLGSFVHGYVSSVYGSGTNLIEATSAGSFAQGTITTGAGATIRASGSGSMARGRATDGTILASGYGAFACGSITQDSQSITASGAGALAVGSVTSTTSVVASAANSVQFGPGTNADANSVKVGVAGLQLKGTTGAFGTLANGQIWLNNNYVYIRSNGVSCKVTNAVL